MDNVIPMTDEQIKKNEEVILGTNAFEIGDYFRKLLREGLPESTRPLFFILARSNGYVNNDPTLLLQLAQEARNVAQVKTDFVNNHLDELFLPGAAKRDVAELDFLDTKIIPFLEKK